MYSKIVYINLYLGCLVNNLTGGGSLKFNLQQQRFYTTKTSRRNQKIVLGIFLALVSLFVWRTLEIYLWKGGDTNKYFHICYAFTFTGLIQISGTFWQVWFENDLVQILNWILRYAKYFKGKWSKGYNRRTAMTGYLLDGGLTLSFLGFMGFPWTTMFHYLLFPETPIFIPTMFPISNYTPSLFNIKPTLQYGLYLGYLPIVAWYSYTVWLTMMLLVMISMVFAATLIPFIVWEFRAGLAEGKYKSLGKLRSVADNLCFEYICVQLLHKTFMDLAGYFVLLVNGLFGQFILFCNYAVIVNWRILNRPTKILLLLWALCCIVLWMIFLEFCGRYHEESKTTLKSWKKLSFDNPLDKKYLNKFRKACRPLKMGLDGTFTIKRLSVLKFTRAIVTGTFRALLTVGKRS